MSIAEKEEFYQKHHHLPGIPSAEEIKENGLDVGKTMGGMTKNIEENRLDITSLHEEQQNQQSQIKQLKEENERLKEQNEQLNKRLKNLEQKVEQINAKETDNEK